MVPSSSQPSRFKFGPRPATASGQAVSPGDLSGDPDASPSLLPGPGSWANRADVVNCCPCPGSAHHTWKFALPYALSCLPASSRLGFLQVEFPDTPCYLARSELPSAVLGFPSGGLDFPAPPQFVAAFSRFHFLPSDIFHSSRMPLPKFPSPVPQRFSRTGVRSASYRASVFFWPLLPVCFKKNMIASAARASVTTAFT